MVEAVKNCGGDARLTVYESCGHDSWNGAYSEPELFKWLLSHTKKVYEQGEVLSGRQFG